ncbi:hypothetical protein DPMN_011729 [Dreissena polymorpha]|uniref:Uncharacterized protein n=1 Tax=Dreissena polymorpha TaxID=45954 RepID=A0A9D4N4P2_DREPO|nr:hypothetical protein DPMN_011729 [Dreissena polymorpha]
MATPCGATSKQVCATGHKTKRMILTGQEQQTKLHLQGQGPLETTRLEPRLATICTLRPRRQGDQVNVLGLSAPPSYQPMALLEVNVL